jgi:glycine cleavage system aminomethyltransferase T
MMESQNYRITLSPFVPNNLLAHVTYVSPEGSWRPLDDGTWPAVPFVYTDWEHEELSWHDNSYIHAGLNPFLFNDVKGKDLLRMLSDLSVSTFNNFPVGKARHTILCNEKGKIFFDGIVVRRSEDEFITMCLPDPAKLNNMNGNKYDFVSEDTGSKRFFYQLCGPRSLEIVEAAAREDLHDIKFMYSRDANIAGKDIFVLRTGMAGTLGYEVHGKIEDALVVYNALMEAGKPYGVTEIGRHAYRNTHTEGSIPQGTIHYAFAFYDQPLVTGSLDPNSELVYRSPIGLGWEKMINFKHDFVGKAALKAELVGHHNTMVHLIWDTDDVLKIIRTAFEKGNSCDIMDMVEDYDYVHGGAGIRMDEVYDGGKMIGVASGRMLSSKTREMISLCTIDQDYAVEGKIVEVLWGNRGTRQMRIKAKVMLFPYIKEGRNENFDVESIPHPKF